MMTNLFSMFDPSSSYMSMAWMTILIPLMTITTKTSKMKSKTTAMMEKMKSMMETETKHLITETKKGTTKMMTSMFMMIIIMNMMALMPQTFAKTTSLDTNLVMAMIMWATSIMFGMSTQTKKVITHLVPQGTPTPLMNFMVLIEMTSNLIRPVTLCVRLTANMVAGHLLLSLLSEMMTKMSLTTQAALLLMPMTLTILETAVAGIQAYVFTTLVTLYTAENQ